MVLLLNMVVTKVTTVSVSTQSIVQILFDTNTALKVSVYSYILWEQNATNPPDSKKHLGTNKATVEDTLPVRDLLHVAVGEPLLAEDLPPVIDFPIVKDLPLSKDLLLAKDPVLPVLRLNEGFILKDLNKDLLIHHKHCNSLLGTFHLKRIIFYRFDLC